jgi:signal transduction histidine kinase
VAVATIGPVMRLCAAMHEALARLLLDNTRIRELEAQVRELDAARDAATHAELQSLRRLERDLHDGPQQRLVRLGMDLAVAERRLDTEPESARQLLSEARSLASETLEELRALSRGIAPPILVDRGLHAALVAMAARSAVPATVDVNLPAGLTLAEPVETALYFTVSEAMANVAKHSGAVAAAITIRHDGRAVIAEVLDNGTGGAAILPGHGLNGLVDRLTALGGTLTVDSPAGGPTRVVARIPCGS